MADIVKLRTKLSEVNKYSISCGDDIPVLRRKHNPLFMHSTHGMFSRSIKFNVNKALSCLH